MDAAAHLLEITPLHRDGGPPTKLVLGLMLFPQLSILVLLVLLSVYLPVARIFLGVWVVWYAIVGVILVRTVRRRR